MSEKIFTIGPDENFTRTLVNGVWERFGHDPLTLSDVRIFLPTRRACRAVAEAFLQMSDGKAMVLPRLIPLGEADSDEENIIINRSLSDNPDDTILNLKPAMPNVRRTLLLARQIRTAYPELTAGQSVLAAENLAGFIDRSITAGVSFDRLNNLVPDEYSEHWQKTLEFLKIITEHWPDILDAYHCTDTADRRDSLLRAQAQAWESNPPATPVIAAGINGIIPAALDLLQVIAEIDNGFIILPGLDTQMSENDWNFVGDTHPQNGLKKIIERLNICRCEVGSWTTDTTSSPFQRARVNLVRELMRPAETSDEWQNIGPNTAAWGKTACENLSRIDCADEYEEASVISLILRETLETPGKTAALITPDRKLARRVIRTMEKWNVTVNDSAGAPLGQWPVGSFIGLTLNFCSRPDNAVFMLAVLKHPLCRMGLPPTVLQENIVLLEKQLLRGQRFRGGFVSYFKTLEKRRSDAEKNGRNYSYDRLKDFLSEIENNFMPLFNLISDGENHALPEWINAHIAVSENLARSHDRSGAERLWCREDGEAAAGFFTELNENADTFEECDFESYASVADRLVLSPTVRPKTPAHPRVTVLSPMEYRLLNADTVIISSLNEGSRPQEMQHDPWMSRPMMQAYGLPSADRFIGLDAHDFMNEFCASEVYLTRAERVENAPTVKSRRLMRLETVLSRLGIPPETITSSRYKNIASSAEHVNDEDIIPGVRPAPCPPVEYRPKRLSVTDIERWIKDPYGIYAKHILRLRKSEPLEGETDDKEKGTLLHKIFERAVRLPRPLTFEKVFETGMEEFGESCFDEASKASLMPVFTELAAWFVTYQTERENSGIIPIATEADLNMQIPGAITQFAVHGRADRIDKNPDGALSIIDYKSGTLPTGTDVSSGYAPQLLLEAMAAGEGGFKNVTAAPVSSVAYWKLNVKKDETAEIKEYPSASMKMSADELIADTKARLLDMIEAFYNSENPAAYTAIPDADNAPSYNDYELLARVKEWADKTG